MLAVLFIAAAVFFVVAYRVYGRFLTRTFGIDDARPTPAHHRYDGVDYIPTHPSVLLGHHFSSIAGAGPIIGPITAAAWFGWLPAYLWCLIGSAFIGGPHDTGSLVASIRHGGRSVGEVVRGWIGNRGRFLFLCFTILTLVLIVAVFLQLAADSLAADPTVAFAATVYMVAALIFGLMVYRFGIPLWAATVLVVPVVFGACYLGHAVPAFSEPFAIALSVDPATSAISLSPDRVLNHALSGMETWRLILVAYVVVAALLPVWLLLQPRDYLSSFFLYAAVVIGAVGMLFGSFFGIETTLPAVKTFVADAQGKQQYLWPMLFVVVACGAVSGFHSMVGSGTSSKQLRRESDAKIIGYGAMLLEGMVAVIAIGTVMIAGTAEGTPIETFAAGFARFAGLIGMDPALGASMGALAINVFILTTLDTATRLTRYQIQEFSGGRVNRYFGTLIAVAAALALLFSKSGDQAVWKLIWPVFGSANQLVAGLALLAIAVWVKRALGADNRFLMIPMWFMLVTTIAALGLLICQELVSSAMNPAIVGVSTALIVLAVLMVVEARRALAIPAGKAG